MQDLILEGVDEGQIRRLALPTFRIRALDGQRFRNSRATAAKQLATSTCAAPNNKRTDRDGDHKTNAELVDDVFR
jgi:hypothetical protein